MEIINLTYKSTSSYLVPYSDGWIMVDAGWPDTLLQLLQSLQQNEVPLKKINYLIVTHFHPGHAGLTQNLKEYGLRLLLHTCQVPYISKLNAYFKKNPGEKFKDITDENNLVITSEESRALLKEIGLDGEIVQTPGHSDDSVSLVLDNTCAFTGDLPKYFETVTYQNQEISESWNKIINYNVKNIYPAHEDPYPIKQK